jgi:4-hydroxybenzoate polyprenyltransferase
MKKNLHNETPPHHHQHDNQNDITTDHHLVRFFSPRLRPYALLMRLDRPIGTWLLLLPALWAIMMAAGGAAAVNVHDMLLFVYFAIGAIVMRGAGCVVNDLWDRDLDRKVARTAARPLASGAVSVKQAFVFLFVLLFIGLLILLQLSFVAVLLGILSLPLIVLYPLMKRITWWPQLFLGLTFNFGALMGWAAVTNTVSLPALALYIGGIFWTLGYDTIYAHQDQDDDALVGIKSTALKFGDKSRHWISGFYGLFFACVVMAFVSVGASWVALGALSLVAMHLIWQIKTLQPDQTDSALMIFRSNRVCGLLVLIAICLI